MSNRFLIFQDGNFQVSSFPFASSILVEDINRNISTVLIGKESQQFLKDFSGLIPKEKSSLCEDVSKDSRSKSKYGNLTSDLDGVYDEMLKLGFDKKPNFNLNFTTSEQSVPTVSLLFYNDPKQNRENVLPNVTLSFSELNSKTKALLYVNGGDKNTNYIKFVSKKVSLQSVALDFSLTEFVSLLKEISTFSKTELSD